MIDNKDEEDGSHAIKFIDVKNTYTKKLPMAFSHSHMIYSRSLIPI